MINFKHILKESVNKAELDIAIAKVCQNIDKDYFAEKSRMISWFAILWNDWQEKGSTLIYRLVYDDARYKPLIDLMHTQFTKDYSLKELYRGLWIRKFGTFGLGHNPQYYNMLLNKTPSAIIELTASNNNLQSFTIDRQIALRFAAYYKSDDIEDWRNTDESIGLMLSADIDLDNIVWYYDFLEALPLSKYKREKEVLVNIDKPISCKIEGCVLRNKLIPKDMYDLTFKEIVDEFTQKYNSKKPGGARD